MGNSRIGLAFGLITSLGALQRLLQAIVMSKANRWRVDVNQIVKGMVHPIGTGNEKHTLHHE